MSRQHITFRCEGSRLVGTLDAAGETTGLLIVSGGNEIRSGAFGSQASLAKHIAAHGYPVFRFDRRGVGDSEGDNTGFASSGPDIASAAQAFRDHCPQLERIVAFGNCDAASALALHSDSGCDALVLSNPWTFDADNNDDMPTGDAIRSRYADKLRNPKELKRLLTGKVNLSGVIKGIGKVMDGSGPSSALGDEVNAAIEALAVPPTILIAGNDRTGQAFAERWRGRPETLRTCEGASHAYAELHAQQWLEDQVLAALRD